MISATERAHKYEFKTGDTSSSVNGIPWQLTNRQSLAPRDILGM